MSARQYPRQPAVSSHIYSMRSSFSVLCSSLSSSKVMCVCASLNESFAVVTRVQFMCFYLKVCVAAVVDGFLFCCRYGEVTESYVGYTIYRVCLCVCVWMRGGGRLCLCV